MVDYHKELVSALESVLPTEYELALTSKTSVPCYSYQERNNYMTTEPIGATVGYSSIAYTVKVWANNIDEIQHYAKEADRVLRPIGFKRISANELHDVNSSMIQKIMVYEALAKEVY